MNWSSDKAIAYAILRFTFGINICIRGVMRIVGGLDVFAAGLVEQFKAAPLPPAAIVPFATVLPFIETTVGLLLILGLFSRPALIAGGLMMTSLMFGTMLMQNFQLAWLQLDYAALFFVLLALRSWNVISLDGWMSGTAGVSSGSAVAAERMS